MDTNAPKSAVVSTQPEFLDALNAQRLFGLSRSYLYQLVEARKIRSISIRKPGNAKGRRLFDAASIRAFINSHATE
jgi:hypothetical protein